MPPKDDDEPKTTKEVVTKKHKQMLNREELDLSLIAEALGGVLSEEPAVVQPSFAGTGKRSTKKKEIQTGEDPLAKLKRLLKTSRADKYKTNEPVSGKQAQQFDIDIAGKAADEKSGAGGKPGAGQTKSLRGQTITKGPYKGATPIGRREAEILRRYARGQGVGQNPLRSQPGSGAELTAGRKRSLKASARRAVEKQAQARRSAVGKQIRAAGSEALTQMQQQAKKGKEVQSRMTRSVEKWAKKEGPKVLKKVQGEAKPKGQLSLPGLGRAFGRGPTARAAAAQDAAIDIAKDQRRAAGFRDLAKAVETRGKPVKGAAADPWKQFPRKPQKQFGIPKPESSRVPTRLLTPSKPAAGALPAAKSTPVSAPPVPTSTTSITKTGDTKIKPVTVKDITQTVQDKNKPRITKTPPASTKPSQLPPAKTPSVPRSAGVVANLFGLGRSIYKKDLIGIGIHGLQIGQELGRRSREMEVRRKEREALQPIKPGTTISVMGKDGKVKQLTPGEFEKLKPTKTPSVKPAPTPTPKPAEPQTQPSPQKDDTGTKKKAPPVAPPGGDKKGIPGGTGTPDKTKAPVQVPDIFKYPAPVIPRTGTGVKPGDGKGDRRRRRFRLPGLGFPEQPGGKIGRRANPQ